MDKIEELFKESYDKAKEWDDEFDTIKKYGTYQDLVNFCRKTDVKELYPANYQIYCVANIFTRNDIDKKNKEKICKSLDKYNDYVISYEINYNEEQNTEQLLIKTIQGDIKIEVLSEKMKGTLKLHPDLSTLKRIEKCHINTIVLAMQYKNPCHLITGYVYGKSNKSRYLHNWIERKVDNKDVVIDYSMNAIINLRGYYLMRNAISINKIYNKELRNMYQNYTDIINQAIRSYSIYDIYRDDLLRYRKQNRDLNERNST